MHKLEKKDKVVIFLLNERINKMVFAYAILGNGTKMALEYCLFFLEVSFSTDERFNDLLFLKHLKLKLISTFHTFYCFYYRSA